MSNPAVPPHLRPDVLPPGNAAIRHRRRADLRVHEDALTGEVASRCTHKERGEAFIGRAAHNSGRDTNSRRRPPRVSREGWNESPMPVMSWSPLASVDG